MRLINITLFKISLALLAGILCSYYFSLPLKGLYYAIFIAFILLLMGWFYARKQLFQNLLFGSIVYVAFFTLGAWVYQVHQPINHNSHYTKHYKDGEDYVLQLKIKQPLKPNLFNEKFTANLIAVNETTTTGKILLLSPTENCFEKLKTDDIILVRAPLSDLQEPKNPYQFDYANYLNRQGIYHQIRLTDYSVIHHEKGRKTLYGYANSMRVKINQSLIQHGFKENTLALINALLLGQRKELSSEVYSDFATAGAVHILAVSGLHVGIIMLILQFVLKPLERFRKGKKFKIWLIITLLWMFAVLAGLSPSVLRAATMFSLLTYALESNRETSTFNTLILSAFILLLVDPNLIFHVGFQLSYLAVFSIVWIQPMLSRFYHPKFYLDKLLWGILTVTLAVQIGIAPMSIYYFHHFPGLFFITNLVVLPFLGVLLGFGIVVIISTLLNILPSFAAGLYESLLEAMIGFIAWVARQDTYYFDGLSLSSTRLIAIYLLLVSLILVFEKGTYRRFLFVLAALISLQGISFWEKSQRSSQRFIVFHKSRNTIMGYKNNQDLILYTKLEEEEKLLEENSIKNFKTGANVNHISLHPLLTYFIFKDKKILVLDSLNIIPGSNKVDIIILTESPKVHLGRVIDSLQPKHIIADGSNYTSYINRWRRTCKKRKLPFHHTGNEGAFIIE